jgi:hypothetical protein
LTYRFSYPQKCCLYKQWEGGKAILNTLYTLVITVLGMHSCRNANSKHCQHKVIKWSQRGRVVFVYIYIYIYIYMFLCLYILVADIPQVNHRQCRVIYVRNSTNYFLFQNRCWNNALNFSSKM